jgi:AcrR family transcriptional regulator
MTDDRRLTAQGQERKEQLLDHAAQLFAERGYSETRVLDIVQAAGVAKGLFYWYFENKEALFRELVEQNRLNLRRAQAAAIDPDAEPLLQIRQGAEASVRYMARYAHFFSLLEVENLDKQFADELRKGTEVHTADVAAIIRLGVADGHHPRRRPRGGGLRRGGHRGLLRPLPPHRPTPVPVDDLAAFVGRFVVCALASDESIARRVLSTPLTAAPVGNG